MPDSILVTRVRISHIGAHIHDKLREIGQPVAFAQRLAGLEPVRGLPVSLPFGNGLRADTDFWSRIAERRLTVPVRDDIAAKLRRAGVPLRYRGTLAVDAEVPRLEAHLHPFGVVVLTTVDLSWSRPVPLEQVGQQVNRLEGEPATVTVGDTKLATTLGQAAVEAARGLVELLTDPGQGESWELPPHRMTTIISGTIDTPPKAMPTAHSPLHVALHRLSAGDDVVAEPATAFVAQWSGAGYTWPAGSMLYMLDRGTSLLSAQVVTAAAGQQPSTADRHRWLLLLVAYLTALTGLLQATRTSSSPLFRAWAATAATRLGPLFGPGRGYLDWGLVPQALLLRTGVGDDVAQVLGSPLRANPNYPLPAYPSAYG